MNMSEYKTLIYEPGRITRIINNQPQFHNKFGYEFQDEYTDALKRFDQDREAVVAVTLAVGRNFSAGGDMRAYSQKQSWDFDSSYQYTEETWRYEQERMGRIFYSIVDCRKPTICGAQGIMVANGMFLALAQDITIMSEDAFVGVPIIRVSGGGGGLESDMGYRYAMEFFSTGWNTSAQELYRRGIINQVVPLAKLEETVMKYANIIALMPSESLKLIKSSLRFRVYLSGAFESNLFSREMNLTAHLASEAEGREREFYKMILEKGMRAACDVRDKPFEEYGFSRYKANEIDI